MKFVTYFSLLFLSISGLSQDLSAIYEKVSPAVVVIFTEENTVQKMDGIDMRTTSAGLGSGFMISDKRVITAAHVVGVPEQIQVKFLDGEIIPANVVAYHKQADVAMLELIWAKKNAATVPLGNSDDLKVGNRVFIVGAPFGLGQSLSAGYVSGFKKQTEGRNPFSKYEFIQTDAAINTGNSGGPMFNLNGEVVGVVSHITTVTGGFQGIGYAATSNLTSYLLLDNKNPWSGADFYVLTGQIAKRFNLPQPSGLLVQRVVFSSPLGRIGVRGGNKTITIDGEQVIVGGDILLSFDGIQFETTDEALIRLSKETANRLADSSFEVTVWRDGQIVKLGRKE